MIPQLAAARAALSSSAWLLKLGAGALLMVLCFGGGLRVGCSHQAKADQAKIARAERLAADRQERLDVAAGALRDAGATFRAISARTEAERKAAREAARTNAAAVKATEAKAKGYLAERVRLERELAGAKSRDATCARILEMKPCAPLH